MIVLMLGSKTGEETVAKYVLSREGSLLSMISQSGVWSLVGKSIADMLAAVINSNPQNNWQILLILISLIFIVLFSRILVNHMFSVFTVNGVFFDIFPL